MRIPRKDIPKKIDTDGATARQKTGFGDASACNTMGGEHFRMARGVDLEPLLKGLDGDLCQAPHWGYVLDGELTVSFKDGSTEKAHGGDLIHWPPGHSVRADADSEFVLFSPEKEHGAVLDHIRTKVEG